MWNFWVSDGQGLDLVRLQDQEALCRGTSSLSGGSLCPKNGVTTRSQHLYMDHLSKYTQEAILELMGMFNDAQRECGRISLSRAQGASQLDRCNC